MCCCFFKQIFLLSYSILFTFVDFLHILHDTCFRQDTPSLFTIQLLTWNFHVSQANTLTWHRHTATLFNRIGFISHPSIHLINFSIFYNLLSIFDFYFFAATPYHVCMCFAFWFSQFFFSPLFLHDTFSLSIFRSNCVQLKIVVSFRNFHAAHGENYVRFGIRIFTVRCMFAKKTRE